MAVTSNGPNQHRITLQTTLPAPPAAVWKVLTDYNHHAAILPYMSKSRIIRATSNEKTVEQEGKIHILFWTFKMQVTQRVTERPPDEMHFQAITGDFQRLEGTWHIVSSGTATGLNCEFLVQPRRRVPEWAVRFAAKRYLTRMVASLAEHAGTKDE